MTENEPTETLMAVALDVVTTGDIRVDSALARLSDVQSLPTDEHSEVYEDVHQRLQDALADSQNA